MNKSGFVLLTLGVALSSGLDAQAQSAKFEPGKLAILRVGDGTSSFKERQNPVFIDQYDCATLNQDHPSFTVTIPTHGTNAIWINGNAFTEGGMERSADHSILTFPGYCGDILSKKGTPSRLDFARGICAVNADAVSSIACQGSGWYSLSNFKTNPRDVVSDGSNDYWGAGSAMGTLFYNANGGSDVIPFKLVPSTRAVKIINNTLYFSIMASDGKEDDANAAGGIYSFANATGAAVALPKAAGAVPTLAIAAATPYTHTVGFDISPQGNVAYLADVNYGIQKYVKSGSDWKLACNFYIPGYNGENTGILTNAASTTVRAGCFGIAVDFSAAHPILYATTTDAAGWQGVNVNSNRLIRIDDTNSLTSGETITNFPQVLATAGGTNMAFRAVAFTPERRL
jgi:hypothetical protein